MAAGGILGVSRATRGVVSVWPECVKRAQSGAARARLACGRSLSWRWPEPRSCWCRPEEPAALQAGGQDFCGLLVRALHSAFRDGADLPRIHQQKGRCGMSRSLVMGACATLFSVALLAGAEDAPKKVAQAKSIEGAVVRSSAMTGMAVRSPADKDLGKVEDLVIDMQSGSIRYVAISF